MNPSALNPVGLQHDKYTSFRYSVPVSQISLEDSAPQLLDVIQLPWGNDFQSSATKAAFSFREPDSFTLD